MIGHAGARFRDVSMFRGPLDGPVEGPTYPLRPSFTSERCERLPRFLRAFLCSSLHWSRNCALEENEEHALASWNWFLSNGWNNHLLFFENSIIRWFQLEAGIRAGRTMKQETITVH